MRLGGDAFGNLLDLLADGERRTREFVDLLSEFSTYMAICHPGAPRPTPDEVRAAFAERDRRVADHMRTERAKAGEE